MFQVWAVVVWLTEQYWSFSMFILVSAIATAVMNLLDVRKNLNEIRRLSLYTVGVTVIRDGKEKQIDSSELIPGDTVRVHHNLKMPADVVLIEGQATVTEAMLTGEATVVVKSPIKIAKTAAASLTTSSPPGNGTDASAAARAASSLHAAVQAAEMRNTIFCGTQVVELRVPAGKPVLAIVVRTGFETVKGRLVLSILHPKAPAFKFLEQSLRFIGILFACAMVGFGINAQALHSVGTPIEKIVQRGCDMITIVVPPALPLAVTVGTIYALVALRKQSIFCISPPRVNLAGKINCFCFDKTGTLTTEGLELAEIRPSAAGVIGAADTINSGSSANSSRSAAAADGSSAKFAPSATSMVSIGRELAGLLSACHSLTHVQGKIQGDPLEVEVFQFTGAGMEEPHHSSASSSSSSSSSTSASTISLDAAGMHDGDGNASSSSFISRISVPRPPSAATSAMPPSQRNQPFYEGDVIRQFEFIPALQRMGVLVRHNAAGSGNDASSDVRYASYVKGSPEALQTLCHPSSLPSDYVRTLNSYTSRGLRVLGCGYRTFTAAEGSALVSMPPDTARKHCEVGLIFLGFIILENKLKPESAPTIARLRREAGLMLHMATGDNAVSAVAIGKECGIVEKGYRVFIGDTPTTSAVDQHSKQASGADGEGDGSTGGAASLGVTWHDVNDESKLLDPESLLPVDGSSDRPYRLALTGRAFNVLQDEVKNGTISRSLLQRAVVNCVIFARMSPENKAALVEELQSIGLYVGMIGDGANDSMALRAAHVGISLSQVEASVAAPFTYAVPSPSIDAIPKVLLEGRGALTTSFCLFQFMALYSTIQFANALLIVFAGSFLSNNLYLFQDLWVVFILSLTLGNTPSASTLTRKRPSGRLFSAHNLLITFGFIGLTFFLQGIAFFLVRRKEWYGTDGYPTQMDPDNDPEGTNTAIPETTSVFLMANFQYLACAVIFSVGHPWKASPARNRPFVFWLLVVALSAFGLFLLPTDALYKWLSLQRMPFSWNLELLALSIFSFLCYFGFMIGLAMLKKGGYVAKLEQAFFRGPPKPHKSLRRSWEKQFGMATNSMGMTELPDDGGNDGGWSSASSHPSGGGSGVGVSGPGFIALPVSINAGAAASPSMVGASASGVAGAKVSNAMHRLADADANTSDAASPSINNPVAVVVNVLAQQPLTPTFASMNAASSSSASAAGVAAVPSTHRSRMEAVALASQSAARSNQVGGLTAAAATAAASSSPAWADFSASAGAPSPMMLGGLNLSIHRSVSNASSTGGPPGGMPASTSLVEPSTPIDFSSVNSPHTMHTLHVHGQQQPASHMPTMHLSASSSGPGPAPPTGTASDDTRHR